MKKVLSVFLSVIMVFSLISMTATAASDTCIRLGDTSGSTGYSAGSEAVNSYAVENDGATLIFDVLVESVATPSSGKYSQLVAFSGDSNYNYAGYNFTKSAFTAGSGTEWLTANQSNSFTAYSTKSFTWEKNVWYEIAYQFDGNEVTVYLDGIPMVSADVDSSFETKYLILYPQYCTVLIDNLRVCGKDYNVRDRYGDVYAATDFTGVTSASGVSCWDFSGAGYSVSTSGRAMPELSEMLPKRSVTPEISGAYLKYSEAGGSGVVATGVNFTPYNGFTVVQDIRIDRKSPLGNFGVRFGGNYIAGYDFDTGSFLISQRSGYGFNTAAAYTYAKTEHTINLKEVYEFAVRQNGNVVSVYLDGVLMVQAVNDSFATGYNNVEINNYRLGSSVDNLVIAYPDYNVREAEGSTAAKFTFDESADYINDIWEFALGSGANGYSVDAGTPAAAVTVDSVEAADGKATVGISLENCIGYTAFELQVAYPSSMSVSSASVSSALKGTSVTSQSTANPFVLTYAAPDGSTVTDADVMNITFNAPSAYGSYTVTATVIPYIGEIPGAQITGTGTVTVAEPGINVGLPTGIAYDGEVLTWTAAEGAAAYEIYMIYEGEDYEYYIDYVETNEYYFNCDDFIPDPGRYIFKIYLYDENFAQVSVSEDFVVIREEDGSVYGGLPKYALELCRRLTAHVSDKNYSSDNQLVIDELLAEGKAAVMSASDYHSKVAAYDEYIAKLDEIPEGGAAYILGDVNGDGSLTVSDLSIMSKILIGSSVSYDLNTADMDGNGSITATDLSVLKKLFS